MGLRETLDALKRIEQVATIAGLSGGLDEGKLAFALGFELDQGRRQVVFVRPAAETPSGKLIVTFYSPCLVIKQGLLSRLSKDKATDLLRRNASVLMASYGLIDAEGESVIVASQDAILDSLEPSDFLDTALSVAMSADLYEREHNQDRF